MYDCDHTRQEFKCFQRFYLIRLFLSLTPQYHQAGLNIMDDEVWTESIQHKPDILGLYRYVEEFILHTHTKTDFGLRARAPLLLCL